MFRENFLALRDTRSLSAASDISLPLTVSRKSCAMSKRQTKTRSNSRNIEQAGMLTGGSADARSHPNPRNIGQEYASWQARRQVHSRPGQCRHATCSLNAAHMCGPRNFKKVNSPSESDGELIPLKVTGVATEFRNRKHALY